MKYYPGDIVEIINLTSDQVTKIGYATNTYIRDMDKKVIGQRYRVSSCVWAEFSNYFMIELDGYEFNKPREIFIDSQLVLYRRSLLNRIRAYLS